jgi:hypothetical protein
VRLADPQANDNLDGRFHRCGESFACAGDGTGGAIEGRRAGWLEEKIDRSRVVNPSTGIAYRATRPPNALTSVSSAITRECLIFRPERNKKTRISCLF